MTAEALNCPNCGAGVTFDKTRCEFCKTRLKTVACPSCLGLMFLGTQFCGHCGARAVGAAVAEDVPPRNCPRCSIVLTGIEIENTSFQRCERCDGVWVDAASFERICAERESQAAVLGFVGKRPLIAEPVPKISYVPCPDCGQLMNRSNFARASGVIIDVCKLHGVWFDAEELPRIIEFIQKGGMDIAREREKMAIRDERDRLRDERRDQTMRDRRFGGSSFASSADESSGIADIIRQIFD